LKNGIIGYLHDLVERLIELFEPLASLKDADGKQVWPASKN
jgi:hypothetical protein